MLAIGQYVEIQLGVDSLAQGHRLAPKGEQFGQYLDTQRKIDPAPITGRVIAIPEQLKSGLLTSYLIRPDVPAPGSEAGPAVPPDYALPANPGLVNYKGLNFLQTRELHILES